MSDAAKWRRWVRDQAGFWRASDLVVGEDDDAIQGFLNAEQRRHFVVAFRGTSPQQLFYGTAASAPVAQENAALPGEAWAAPESAEWGRPTGDLIFPGDF